jgi:membrane-bound lytic murein transglycosylase D
VLRLPNELVTSFLENEDSIYRHREEEFFPKENIEKMLKQARQNDDGRGSMKRHKIKNGENLGSIARKYRVTVKQIMKWNNLKNADKLSIGQRLRIEQR